jgi:FSR family fosmidomycin resistance protein-like MFS transporter
MSSARPKPIPRARRRLLRLAVPITGLFLAVEFFDELAWASEGAALPILRRDLSLSYAQVGMLLAIPAISAAALEPLLMLLGDTRWRRRLILGGGLALAASFAGAALARDLAPLVVAFAINWPASGAFVTLSQATLMDLNPGRQPRAMARWSLAGSLGSLLGPLIFAAILMLGGSWRLSFAGLGLISILLVALLLRVRFPAAGPAGPNSHGLAPLLKGLGRALADRTLLRWVLLLVFADLMLDLFAGYVPLYFTDVVGASPATASLAIATLTAASLAADVLTVQLLERVPGRRLVRISAALVGVLYPLWLWLPGLGPKWLLLIFLGFSRLGWYAVLQGEAYATHPGRSGTVLAVKAVAGLVAGGLYALIGYAAEQLGLDRAMWLLLAGPLVLVIFVPSSRRGVQ